MNLRVDRSTAVVAAAALAAGGIVGVTVAAVGPAVAGSVALAVVVLTLLRSPGVALALYLFIPPFLKGYLQPFVPVDLTAILGLACALHVAYGMIARPVKIRHRALVLWIALLAMITVGSLYAPDQNLAFSRVLNWLALVMAPLLVVFWVAEDQREVERFIWTCLAVALLVVILTAGEFSPSQRLAPGTLSTINVGRASLMVPIITFFYLMRDGPSWLRGPLLVVTPLALLISIAAAARGPLLLFVALAAALSIWHLARGHRPSSRAVASLTVSVLLLGIIATVTPLPSVSLDSFVRLAAYATGAGTTVDGSIEPRLDAADLAISIFEDHPAVGAGTGAFTHYSQTIPTLSTIQNPHNIVLEIASDWGVMGLVLFLVLVLVAIRQRPPASVWTAVWAVFLFLGANAMLGSFFDYREFWGFGLLLLAAPVAGRPAEGLLGAPVSSTAS